MDLMSYLYEAWSLLSRGINVIRGGSADITFSAASHIEKLESEKYIDRFFKLIRNEDNHCKVWWLAEVERSRKVIELYENSK